ncbi:aromatic-ring-hydroxylating dioxygenase subunit beta [Bacillus sp. B15-48]|uniref:aromatic-ring-hydroxylating dioxygenase subunit beta n=1 Tax=Bacillus sp. B15-48 TaxID=1548601 RepID=UPI00193FE4EA|nr:aromatic-ring-hydroxylating dioxygenase subunit beta [Bacillus sp. B15-48]MBM4763640.1 ring-hydroxylating dioxygenase subunit beta [Bacillus sp. B15-48]
MQTKVKLEQIETFLYKEARYINSHELDEWLDMFTDDCIYWLPCNSADIDPETHVSIIYDNRERLEERVWRLQTGLAYGQEPRSETCHLITNVEVLDENEDEIIVTSNLMLTELRRGIQTIYTARMEHHLVPKEDDFKIRFKKIELLNNNEYLGNMSFLL